MHRDRLTVLRDYLRSPAVKPEAFTISFWWRTGDEFECGYAGCAVGHACQIPEFNAAGLALNDGLDDECPFPVFEDLNADDAVGQFFGLLYTQVGYLFYASAYKVGSASQWAVANRIDELLNATPTPTGA